MQHVKKQGWREGGVCWCVLSARRDHSSLADTLPDPVRSDPLGLAVLWICQGVCGRGGVVLRHQISVVRYKVALQLLVVRTRVRQEELYPAEDV